MSLPLRLSAHAKVNLHLFVLGQRPDGFHLVRTCLHSLELADEITAELGGDGVQLTLEGELRTGLPVAADQDNLICRAARAFGAASGIEAGVKFRARKRIPAGSGLGGGSSDAAAALLLMNALHGGPLTPRALHDLAAGIGADVPFFLYGGTHIGTGVGDRLTAVDAAPMLHFVLLLPPFGLSTARVYQSCGAPRLTEADDGTTIRATGVVSATELAVPARYVNELEPAAMEVEPRLAELRDRVVAAGFPQVRMSGSGSALFVAFPEEQDATRATEQLSFLSRHGVVAIQTRSALAPSRVPEELDAEGER